MCPDAAEFVDETKGKICVGANKVLRKVFGMGIGAKETCNIGVGASDDHPMDGAAGLAGACTSDDDLSDRDMHVAMITAAFIDLADEDSASTFVCDIKDCRFVHT